MKCLKINAINSDGEQSIIELIEELAVNLFYFFLIFKENFEI